MIYTSLSLGGSWEMGYSEDKYIKSREPVFEGFEIENAVPGYWEDMTDKFIMAPFYQNLKVNPSFGRQKYPIAHTAPDMALPNYMGNFFYKRSFVLDDISGDCVLHFGGIQNTVSVWVNSIFLGTHCGYSAPFDISVPQGVLTLGDNTIVLSVSNFQLEGYGGKAVSGLTNRAANEFTGGITADIELRIFNSSLRDVNVLVSSDCKTVYVKPDMKENEEFTWEIIKENNVLLSGTANSDFSFCASSLEFWSPETPVLYTLRLKCGSSSIERNFGVRRLNAEGDKLYLNGTAYFLRGVCEHCYFPKTIHPTDDIAYYRNIIKTFKKLGFNFIRFHTFVPCEQYMQAADELGMLLHIECPNNTSLSQWKEIVAFCRKHTSVVIYCCGNELYMTEDYIEHLSHCADVVHSMTDSLFSPQSALRGVEYFIDKSKKDEVSGIPFTHNHKKFDLISKFSDMYSSYANEQLSYDSLDADAQKLDSWASVYKKPRVSHEICIDGTYTDLSLKDRYRNLPVGKTDMFTSIESHLESKGVLDKAPLYFINSCKWQRRVRKYCFEMARRCKTMAGFDFLGPIDTHWHTFGYDVGMMNEFYELKPDETVRNVLMYNSPCVLLNDLSLKTNFKSGEIISTSFFASDYSKKDISFADFNIRLFAGDEVIKSEKVKIADIRNGKVSEIYHFEYKLPKVDKPTELRLYVSLDGDGVFAENEWELYLFPKVSFQTSEDLLISDGMSEEELMSALADGKNVILFGGMPFTTLNTSFRIALAGRTSGNLATVIYDHPILKNIPHDGFCGWQFSSLMTGGSAVCFESDNVTFDPIVEVVSTHKYVIRQSSLFEFSALNGKLIVCTMNFNNDDSASAYLKSEIIKYAKSKEFNPRNKLSQSALYDLIHAKVRVFEDDNNLAFNSNDITML